MHCENALYRIDEYSRINVFGIFASVTSNETGIRTYMHTKWVFIYQIVDNDSNYILIHGDWKWF